LGSDHHLKASIQVMYVQHICPRIIFWYIHTQVSWCTVLIS